MPDYELLNTAHAAACEFHDTDAEACVQFSGAAPCTPTWCHHKPTIPGAYWVRGNGLDADALINVTIYEGDLWCNLHQSTTEPNPGRGYRIAQLSDSFEWLGPLQPAIPQMALVHSLQHRLDQAIAKSAEREGMAASMDLLRRDLIEAGVISDKCPPMFMTEVILSYINKLRQGQANSSGGPA